MHIGQTVKIIVFSLIVRINAIALRELFFQLGRIEKEFIQQMLRVVEGIGSKEVIFFHHIGKINSRLINAAFKQVFKAILVHPIHPVTLDHQRFGFLVNIAVIGNICFQKCAGIGNGAI